MSVKTEFARNATIRKRHLPPLSIFSLFLLPFLLPACSKPIPMSGATAWSGGQTFDALAVEGVTARTGKLVVAIPGSGTVSGVREAAVVSQTQGVITAVGFTAGERVKEGHVLLRLDDRLARFNLKRASDQLDSATLDLKATQIQFDSGGTSASSLARAQSNESAARAQYEQAKKSLDDTVITAPIAGIIVSRDSSIMEGNVIGLFAAVAKIVDDSAFRVTVGVGEGEIGRVRPGLSAAVLIPSAFGDKTVTASVTAVGGGADPQTGSFPVVVGFDNAWGSLVKSGMSARVEISPDQKEESVIVPLASLVRRGERYALFVESGGRATIREVDVGAKNGVKAEIARGVQPGETIIVSALSRLVDGTPVAVTVRGDSPDRE